MIEEGLHALAARPWASAIDIDIDLRAGTAKTIVEFPAGTPQWAIRAAYLAPEVAAAVAGVAVIAFWFVHGPLWLPVTTLDWALLAVLGAQYLAIALPSASDADHTATQQEVTHDS